MSDIQRALTYVRERIAEAALRAGRDPSSVTLIAVSKTFPPEDVMEAITASQLDFGENRVEEALPKMAAVSRLAEHGCQNADDTRQDAERAIRNTQYPIPNTPCAPQDAQSEIQNLKSKIRWHLIGHLQSRKVRDAAGHFSLIHSVDSVRLAETLDRRVANVAPHAGPVIQDVLLECNVSGEETKSGFDLAGWERDVDKLNRFADDVTRILSLSHLRVLGLMTMAPIVDHPDQARPYFASLRALRDALAEQMAGGSLPHLSMGMTDDFEAAIAEGATLVRIGRAIFGIRQN